VHDVYVCMHACMHVCMCLLGWIAPAAAAPCSHHYFGRTIQLLVLSRFVIPFPHTALPLTHTHTHTHTHTSSSSSLPLLPLSYSSPIIIIIIIIIYFSSRNTTSAHVSPEDPTQDIPLSSMVPSTNSISYPREY
jgi:hypothetical protein